MIDYFCENVDERLTPAEVLGYTAMKDTLAGIEYRYSIMNVPSIKFAQAAVENDFPATGYDKGSKLALDEWFENAAKALKAAEKIAEEKSKEETPETKAWMTARDDLLAERLIKLI